MKVQITHPVTEEPLMVSLEPDDIIVVRLVEDDALDEAFTLASQIKHVLQQKELERTLVLVGANVTVEGLNPDVMREAGWVRADED